MPVKKTVKKAKPVKKAVKKVVKQKQKQKQMQSVVVNINTGKSSSKQGGSRPAPKPKPQVTPSANYQASESPYPSYRRQSTVVPIIQDVEASNPAYAGVGQTIGQIANRIPVDKPKEASMQTEEEGFLKPPIIKRQQPRIPKPMYQIRLTPPLPTFSFSSVFFLVTNLVFRPPPSTASTVIIFSKPPPKIPNS